MQEKIESKIIRWIKYDFIIRYQGPDTKIHPGYKPFYTRMVIVYSLLHISIPAPLNIPPTQNIVEIAQGNPNFSILVDAVIKADLAGTLSGDGPFTVFAPTNEAFLELLDILNVDSLDDIPVSTLTAVLLYHVAEGRVYSSDLVTGPVNTLGGTFVVDVPTLTIDSGSDQDANLDPEALNIQGTNGAIHVIDKVLLP